jgi:hypothetical protein
MHLRQDERTPGFVRSLATEYRLDPPGVLGLLFDAEFGNIGALLDYGLPYQPRGQRTQSDTHEPASWTSGLGRFVR